MAEPTYLQAKLLYDNLKVKYAELEQQFLALRSGIGQNHVDRFIEVNDGLLLVVQQAEKGDPAARQQLQLLVGHLDRARAAASGIALPASAGAGDRQSAVPS